MREYELFLVVNPELGKQELTEFEKRLVGLFANNGGVLYDLEGPDKMKLAYEIKHQTRGYRYVGKAYLPPEAVSEVLRHFRVMDNLLRFFITLKGKTEVSPEQVEEAKGRPLRQFGGVEEARDTEVVHN